MLFTQFRFGQWVRLAVVGFLAGEMGQMGGNIPMDFLSGLPSSNSDQLQLLQGPLRIRTSFFIVIALFSGIVLALAIGIALLYVSSRMRFVLFDSMLAGECHIRRFWRQRRDPAWQYFVWQLGLALITVLAMLFIFGPPIAFAALRGWFVNPRDHVFWLIVGGGLIVVLLLIFVIVLVLIQTATKDFVVPQMALEGISAVEGWRRFRVLLRSELLDYLGYVGMKIVMAIAASIILGIISFIVLLLLLLPVGGFGVFAILGGRAAGLTWNPLTIALAVVAGAILLLSVLFLVALISVPAIVFFPAYSIHFFESRYAPLHRALSRGRGTAPAPS
jgi:hypothetical protein